MEKIAIISDVHSNLEALEATLKDIKSKKIDKIYCLGDIILKGSNPNECMELITKNCEVIVKGNTDNIVVIGEDRPHTIWTREKLDNKWYDFIDQLPLYYDFYLSGRLVRLMHASPHNIAEKLNPCFGLINTDLTKEYQRLFDNTKLLGNENSILEPDVVIFGHIHSQFSMKIGNRLVLNPGSISNSAIVQKELVFGKNFTSLSNYIILEGSLNSEEVSSFSYNQISIPYDINKVLKNAEDSGMPLFEDYKTELSTGLFTMRKDKK